MSKYIPNRSPQRLNKQTWSNFSAVAEKEEEFAENHKAEEKARIESIELDTLSFTDLYQLPFHQPKYGSWVYDAIGNFVLQFEAENKEFRTRILEILNKETTLYNRRPVKAEGGYIQVQVDGEWKNFILIRGWGNLTGCGSYNLRGEYAEKIQDTLSDYIVEKLNIES